MFWAFPDDRKLAGLRLLSGPSAALDRLVGAPVTPRLVAYSAESSATAACTGDDGRVVAYVKVHAGADRERRALAAALAADGDRLRVPRVLGSSGDALAVEAVPGRRAGDLGPLGAALATLHARAPLPRRRFARLDPDRLARAARVIARARPDAGPAAAALVARLGARPEGDVVALHGDVNARNVIDDGERVALIDYEEAAAGPAAADLGQLLAAGAGDELLAGYASVRPLPSPAALRWYAAASTLARIALPAVSRYRPDALERLPELLEAA